MQEKLEYGVSSDSNANTKSMEDTGTFSGLQSDFYKRHGAVYFLVLDGHGGADFANEMNIVMQKNLMERYQNTFDKKQMVDFMSKIIQDSNQEILKSYEDQKVANKLGQKGACICLCIIRYETYKGRQIRVVYSSNLGDTRSVLLMDNNEAKRLSYDHKSSDIFLQREYNKNEEVITSTNNGIRFQEFLMVCRAVGDFEFDEDQQCYKLVHPQFDTCYVKRKVIQPKHKYLVIASDGLYDNISDDRELSYWMKTNPGRSHNLAQLFTHKAFTIKEQIDNIYTIVVQLQELQL